MANHSATKKSIRKIAHKTAHRRSLLSAVKTSIRNFNESLATEDKEKIQDMHKKMQSSLMKASKRNLTHKNTVARKISRLTKKIKATS
tara:strand:+ start:237 stop:500 length:264 start_codon:yes stop_codon:yes gene_type:complete